MILDILCFLFGEFPFTLKDFFAKIVEKSCFKQQLFTSQVVKNSTN